MRCVVSFSAEPSTHSLSLTHAVGWKKRARRQKAARIDLFAHTHTHTHAEQILLGWTKALDLFFLLGNPPPPLTRSLSKAGLTIRASSKVDPESFGVCRSLNKELHSKQDKQGWKRKR